jgi:hypothetical protein
VLAEDHAVHLFDIESRFGQREGEIDGAYDLIVDPDVLPSRQFSHLI